MSRRERSLQRDEQQRKRKRRRAFRERSKKRQPGQAHSIPSFCINNMISESLYYSLKRRGKGPRETELDGRIIILPQAEEDWRRERERETQELRAKREREEQQAAI